MTDWDFCKHVDVFSTDLKLESLHRWEPDIFFGGRSVKLVSCCRLLDLFRGTLKEEYFSYMHCHSLQIYKNKQVKKQ